ncbi:MarR family transcriptional regulator [Candidatus Woesearchaeota archaeon]|nr:MarR family transcriptional regulator [Candidatus Woesearchaeota archaeon]
MQLKTLGMMLIILAVLLAGLIYVFKIQEDKYLAQVMKGHGGSCFVDGVCIYESRSIIWYVFGWVVSAFLFTLGVYLYFFDKTQQQLIDYQKNVAESLKEAQKKVSHEDKFKAFLAGFSEEEQKVLNAIKDQDGIQQSTLRYRTGMSKSTLSLMLKNFEEKGLISRKEEGKTNKIFWKKVY